jgi:hypothetical protein
MKFLNLLLAVASVLSLSAANAQTMGVKDIPAEGDTTIRIEKGSRTDNKFEVITNKDEIEGESSPLLKEARANWDTACKDWKKETKELHKENQIIALNCGKRNCSTSAMETSCTSEGTSKVKVRVQ